MSRLALCPTDTFIGHHALTGMSMAMDCLLRTSA
jgi:hypothetical protein